MSEHPSEDTGRRRSVGEKGPGLQLPDKSLKLQMAQSIQAGEVVVSVADMARKQILDLNPGLQEYSPEEFTRLSKNLENWLSREVSKMTLESVPPVNSTEVAGTTTTSASDFSVTPAAIGQEEMTMTMIMSPVLAVKDFLSGDTKELSKNPQVLRKAMDVVEAAILTEETAAVSNQGPLVKLKTEDMKCLEHVDMIGLVGELERGMPVLTELLLKTVTPPVITGAPTANNPRKTPESRRIALAQIVSQLLSSRSERCNVLAVLNTLVLQQAGTNTDIIRYLQKSGYCVDPQTCNAMHQRYLL